MHAHCAPDRFGATLLRVGLNKALGIRVSVELRNASGATFEFRTLGWAFYLLLAEGYGWKPSGTHAPADWESKTEQWSGAYDWNAGQTVSANDASALAIALGKYVADAERHRKASKVAAYLNEKLKVTVEWDGEDRQFVASFINFAQQGAFEIW